MTIPRAGHERATAGAEKKKLAILSMFGGHKGPAPIAAGGGGFFGQYGL